MDEPREILFERRDGVARITLNRPERLNAYTGRMGEELGAAYRACDADDDVRAVVLTGAGRAFCAGADLAEGAATFARRDAVGFSAAGVEPPAWRVRKPVIAALNGHAIGIGLTLALQCDLRLVAREGRYGIVQVRLGVMPDACAHWTLPRQIGLARAAELLLTGRRMSGEEAYALGLANRLLPAAEVLPAALELAREIARNVSPLSAAVSKRLLWESAGLSPEAVARKETLLHHHLMERDDAAEGPRAQLARREPEFRSRVSRDFPDPWPE